MSKRHSPEDKNLMCLLASEHFKLKKQQAEHLEEFYELCACWMTTPKPKPLELKDRLRDLCTEIDHLEEEIKKISMASITGKFGATTTFLSTLRYRFRSTR